MALFPTCVLNPLILFLQPYWFCCRIILCFFIHWFVKQLSILMVVFMVRLDEHCCSLLAGFDPMIVHCRFCAKLWWFDKQSVVIGVMSWMVQQNNGLVWSSLQVQLHWAIGLVDLVATWCRFYMVAGGCCSALTHVRINDLLTRFVMNCCIHVVVYKFHWSIVMLPRFSPHGCSNKPFFGLFGFT